VAAFGISGRHRIASLLASHPPIEERIARLRQVGTAGPQRLSRASS
jgi:Zn-dependent protease with chaperone function